MKLLRDHEVYSCFGVYHKHEPKHDPSWKLGSATQLHACKDRALFTALNSSTIGISTGHCLSTVSVAAQGTVIINTMTDGMQRTPELKDCLFIPGLRSNLVSEIKLELAGAAITSSTGNHGSTLPVARWRSDGNKGRGFCADSAFVDDMQSAEEVTTIVRVEDADDNQVLTQRTQSVPTEVVTRSLLIAAHRGIMAPGSWYNRNCVEQTLEESSQEEALSRC